MINSLLLKEALKVYPEGYLKEVTTRWDGYYGLPAAVRFFPKKRNKESLHLKTLHREVSFNLKTSTWNTF